MQLPATFGKYELLERIATGGMAEVFLARSFGVAGFEKRLVIKRIRPELALDPRFISMFINEAKIGVHLNHPNVVHLYDLGRVGSSYYIAMEHLHGCDLTRLVKTLRAHGERLPLPVAVAVVAEACRGLAYAHGRTGHDGQLLGLVHRDVSPHNLVVTFDGEVKLVDFGIARLINTAQARADGAGPGRPGGGKYAYMSPEQARGDDVDLRTDIFSAGIVLWELLVGHRLFQDPDPAEKLRKVQEAAVPHPRTEGVDVDDRLWRILQRALAKDPADRYASAALLEEDLRAWLFHAGHRVGRADIATEMRRAFPDEARRSPAELDLDRIVADVERLDAEPTTTTGPGTPSDTPLPGHLRPSEGERKRVVVVVIDVDGLTDLSARVEPEHLFKRHYQLLRWVRRVTDRYGGVVQRAVDDQLVLLFGAPRTRVDDVPRALECALELQRTVGELRGKGLSVDLAVGVHTGEVTVGAPRRQVRYVARGDTTRLARRLSAIADHGQIVVSERVLRDAEGSFRLRRGPDIRNRGGKPATASYLLEGRRRGLRVAGKGPWLRRGSELDVIRDALVRLRAGKGALIGLVGGLGSGKSRLVREIRDLAHRRGLPTWLARCTPFGADPPMEPFRDLVRDVLGVDADDPPDRVWPQLVRLSQLGLGHRDIDAIASLLGVAVERVPKPHTEETWRALERMVRGLSRDGPVIVAIEDVHLLGPVEQAHVERLVRRALSLPILFLFTSRQPLPPSLREHGTQVALGGFGPDKQRRLLANLLEVDAVDDALFALVERTCEGNPLYVGEMVKYLLQERRIRVVAGHASLVDAGAPGLPDSLAGLISSRIDALDPASKGALQLAAVIGTTFSEALLAEAAGVDDPTPLLSELSSHGLVLRDETGGDDWTFASELVREATLRGILGVQRRDYHRLVAAGIEALHADDLDTWAETLAHHCADGGRKLDAARYAFRAGERLERRQFLDRARALLRRGLTWIGDVPDDPEHYDPKVQGEALLNYRYGVVCILLGDSRAGERALQVALDIASEAGLPWVEVRAHVELGRSYLQRGRTDLARAHLTQARALMHLEDDPELSLETLEATAVLAHAEGRNAEAEALWQEALALADGSARAQARCLLGLANRHLRAGHTEDAAPLLDRALHAARRAGDRILEGRVLNNMGLVHTTQGDHERALEHFRRALQVREGIGYTRGVMVNHHNIGDAHFARGDWARAHVSFQRSRELAREMGWDRGVTLNDMYLGYIDAVQGREGEGMDRLHRATEAARGLADPELVATGLWLTGRRLIEAGRVDDARTLLVDALDEARRYELGPVTDAVTRLLAEID